nr:carbon starvation CstA family protein [Corynebacterium accolens]
MNSLVLAILGVAMMVAGYLLYSKYLGKSIFRLSKNYTTPGPRSSARRRPARRR